MTDKMAIVAEWNVDYETEYRRNYNEQAEQNFIPQELQDYKFFFLGKCKLIIQMKISDAGLVRKWFQNPVPLQLPSLLSLCILNIVTDLINALPGNSPVNTVQHATVEETVFSVDPTDAPTDWLDSDHVMCLLYVHVRPEAIWREP
jgi:hypothetical protein